MSAKGMGRTTGPKVPDNSPARDTPEETDVMATTRQSRKEQMIRRGTHVLYSFVVIYFFLPDRLFFDIVPKWMVLILFLSVIPLSFEYWRLKRSGFVLGLREHEKDHIASYAWFCQGTVLLILFLPDQIAAPCIVVTAVGDVVIGVTKPYRRRYSFSIALLVCILIYFIFSFPWYTAIFAGVVAFIAESVDFEINARIRPNIFYSRSKQATSRSYDFFKWAFRSDDDFMMQVIPGFVLGVLFLATQHLYPDLSMFPDTLTVMGLEIPQWSAMPWW